MERRNSERVLAKDFAELKKNRLSDAERIAALAAKQHFGLGTKRKTRMRLSGVGRSGTLLHKQVADEHGELLFEEYRERINGRFQQERLRYLTVIHSLVGLDENDVLTDCERMVAQLRTVLVGKVWWLGVIETELVNLDLLRSFQEQDENVRHKLEVINALDADGVAERSSDTSTRVLVHCHIVVDFGKGSAQVIGNKSAALREDLTKVWSIARQVELKRFSEQWRGKRRTLRENIWHIGKYGTKCGNEMLRYKMGFGRDYDEDTEAQMWKRFGKDLISDDDDGVVEDRRGLTGSEIKFLDAITRRLMDRRGSNDGRGYVIGTRRR